MRFSATRLFPLILMLALALLTFYLERAARDDDAHPSLRRHDPDYLVTQFTTTSYDRNGVAGSVLSASQMTHYPDDDSTELTEPRMLQSRPAEPRLRLRADRGQLSSGGDEVFLYDNVVLVREADKAKPQARVTTSFLHVLRERSVVRTDRTVQIVDGRRSISGRGMEYRNETSEFLMRNNVTAKFEPRARK